MSTSKLSLRLFLPAGVVVTLLSGWLLFSDNQPPWPEFEGSIFVGIQTAVGRSEAEAEGGVFELTSGEEGIRQLTEELPNRFHISTDSEWLAWAKGNRVAMRNLSASIADAEAEPLQVDAAGFAGSPVCGEDGSWLAWTGASMEVAEQMVSQRMQVPSEQLEVLSMINPLAAIWDWSDQRQAFLATTNDESVAGRDILLIDLEGQETPIADTGVNSFPRFSHAGSQVLFIHHAKGLSSIHCYNLDSKETSVVYGPTAMGLRACCWSPDDTSIGFLINEDPQAIQILKLQGGDGTPERLMIGRSKWIGGLTWNASPAKLETTGR